MGKIHLGLKYQRRLQECDRLYLVYPASFGKENIELYFCIKGNRNKILIHL